MTPDEAQAAVRAERLHLADLLDDLAPSEWDEPSLCDAWSVHDVAAHLTTTTRETPWDVIRAVVRARFDGAGPVVRGPAEDLLLAVAGRPAGLAALTGSGLPQLAYRVS